MEKAREYHDKLLHIKREMHALHDKSAKLKVLVKFDYMAKICFIIPGFDISTRQLAMASENFIWRVRP